VAGAVVGVGEGVGVGVGAVVGAVVGLGAVVVVLPPHATRITESVTVNVSAIHQDLEKYVFMKNTSFVLDIIDDKSSPVLLAAL